MFICVVLVLFLCSPASFHRFGVETQYTDYDNLDYFSPNGTVLAPAPIEAVYDTMADSINKIRNKADNDLSLGACMEQAFKELKYAHTILECTRCRGCSCTSIARYFSHAD